MKMRRAWLRAVLSCLAITLIASSSRAQGYPGVPVPQPMGYDAAQGGFYGPGAVYSPGGPLPGAHVPVALPLAAYPASYGVAPSTEAGPAVPGPLPGPAAGPMMPVMATPNVYGSYGELPVDYAGGMPPDTGCPYCYGRGCDACRHLLGHRHRGGLFGGMYEAGHGLCSEIWQCIGPYPDGGCAAIRWYDIAVDFMMLKRDDAGRNINLTSAAVGGGDFVLATNDLDFDYEPSFRFSGALQLGPGSNVEFTYFGLFTWIASAQARSASSELFSLFTDFGLIPGGGQFIPEFDQSNLQRIDYTSTFDSFEVNLRHRWMSPNCRYQGSWLVGVRYFLLDEEFSYLTNSGVATGVDITQPAQSRTTVITTNSLTGLQIGGDVWFCLVPGLRVGAEAKAGVYGNHMNVNSTLTINTALPPDNVFVEELKKDDVAFVGQVDILATYRLSYAWTARGGYQLLFVDGVALAPENLNPVPPNLSQTLGLIRRPFVNDNGNLFYHGWFAGLEFMW